MRNALEPWHIIILLFVIVMLFGAKRLPDTARGLGRSLRIFKAETKGLIGDDSDATPNPEPTPAPARAIEPGVVPPTTVRPPSGSGGATALGTPSDGVVERRPRRSRPPPVRLPAR